MVLRLIVATSVTAAIFLCLSTTTMSGWLANQDPVGWKSNLAHTVCEVCVDLVFNRLAEIASRCLEQTLNALVWYGLHFILENCTC